MVSIENIGDPVRCCRWGRTVMGVDGDKIRVGLAGGLAAVLGLLLLGQAAWAAAANPQVSLDVAESTLREALEDLSRQTGYAFDLDPQWGDQRVTLKVQDITLRECLQRLLVRFNYAIVFEDDKQIALNIFGEQTAVRGGPVVGMPYPRAPALAAPPEVPGDEEQSLEDELNENGEDLDRDAEEEERDEEEEVSETEEVDEVAEAAEDEQADEAAASDEAAEAGSDENGDPSGEAEDSEKGAPDTPNIQLNE